jgi:hypothetical protein
MATRIKPLDENYVRMYYEHQYQRMSAIEGQRWALTNIVATLSVLAFTFGFQDGRALTIINGLALPIVLTILNLFAVLFVWRTHNYTQVHQRRARATLLKYAKELHELDTAHPVSRGPFGWGIAKIQLIIHIILLIPALIPFVGYLLQ